MLYIGVDLGTSSVKLLLIEKYGTVLETVTKEYDVEYPHPGWSQQNTEDWLRRTVDGIQEILSCHDVSAGERSWRWWANAWPCNVG